MGALESKIPLIKYDTIDSAIYFESSLDFN